MTNETQTQEKKAIETVVQDIWKPISDKVAAQFREFQDMSEQELVDWLVKRDNMGYYTYGQPGCGTSMNLFPTSGCPHRFSTEKGKFEIKGGCSMCNYHSEFVDEIAAMKALREKNPQAYGKVIRDSFTRVRGNNPQPNGRELITANDTLDPDEFSIDDAKQLFRDEKGGCLFASHPNQGYTLEARANSMVDHGDKIREMKDAIGTDHLSIEIGVEVGDGKGGVYDFLRNYWINKNISSEQVEKAIEVAHKNKCRITTNVIAGIPGLTEDQAVDAAVTTIKWLDDIGSDDILLLPLNLKKYTIQEKIHELKGNPELEQSGLAQDEHTGVSWFYTMTRIINKVVKERPSIKHKLTLAQISSNTNSINNIPVYNGKRDCECTSRARNTLIKSLPSIDYEGLAQLGEDYSCPSCHDAYTNLVEKQKAAGTIPETLGTIYKHLCYNLYGEGSEKARYLVNKFETELKEVTENENP